MPPKKITTTSSAQPETATNKGCTLEDIFAGIELMHNELKNFKESTSDQLTSLSNEVKGISASTSNLDVRMASCETATNGLTHEVELLRQAQLKCNVAISNVPFVRNENLPIIVNTILDKINATELTDCIDNVYRTKSGTIIVQFDTERSKRYAIQQKRVKKALLVIEIGYLDHEASKQVIINDHLTPYFGKLSYLARQLVNKKEIHACWMTPRGLCVKVVSDGPTTVVMNEEQIQSLIVNKRKASTSLEPEKAKKQK